MDRFSAKTSSSPKNNQVLSSRGRGRDGFSRRTRERLTPHAPRLDEQPYGITTRMGCSPCPHLDLGHHSPTSWPVSLHQRHQQLYNPRSPRTLADLYRTDRSLIGRPGRPARGRRRRNFLNSTAHGERSCWEPGRRARSICSNAAITDARRSAPTTQDLPGYCDAYSPQIQRKLHRRPRSRSTYSRHASAGDDPELGGSASDSTSAATASGFTTAGSPPSTTTTTPTVRSHNPSPYDGRPHQG